MKSLIHSCLLLLALRIFAQQPCDIIYVAPNAPNSAGTSSSPTNLIYGLSLVSGTRLYVRMLEGVYNINSIVTIPAHNVKIDGGYRQDAQSNWVKRSDAVTSINFSGSRTDNVSGIPVGHAIGFEAANVNGWTLQDLTVYVVPQLGTTSSRGHSAYGIHIQNCSGYTISRCAISSGNGTNGLNGANVSGTGGAGGGGAGGGGSGQTSGCGGSSGSGGSGQQGNGGASGGNGGGGVGNGSCNIFGCDAGGSNGRNGGSGAGGANGTGYSPGDRPSPNTNATLYYVPNGQTNGGNGFGGGGGGGGSGAALGTCCLCSCGNGNARGGDGGNGGDGGMGGEGGFGGGGSFPIYAYGAGSGTIEDCSLQAGGGGTGGSGTNGQSGSAGSFGQAGGYHSRCSGFYGGNGQQGGSGGSGGRGRDGANGLSSAIIQYAGAVVNQSGSYPINPPLAVVNYQNINACTYSEINILKTSGTWNLSGTGAAFVNDLTSSTSSFSNTSNSANIYFTSTGNKNIILNGNIYKGFITIGFNRNQPSINPLPAAICVGGSITLGTSETATTYEWKITDQNGNLFQSFASQNPGSYTPPAVGLYNIKFRAKTDCCGWSVPVYAAVDVQAYPVVILSGLNPAYCLDDVASPLTGTPAGGTFTGTLVSGNIFDPQNANVGSHQIIYTYATPIGCQSADTVSTQVLPLPVVTFTGLNPDYCINEPGAVLVGNPAGGVFSGAGIGGSTFIPFLAGVGSHDVTYTYVSPNGCDAAQTQATIINDQPVLSFTISPTTYCVDGSPVPLSATPAGGSFSGTGVSGNFFIPGLAGIGGPYTITYTFTDTIGCRNTSTTTETVSVVGLPTVAISGLGAEYCADANPVTLTGLPFGGTFTGSGVTSGIFYPSLAGAGSHTVTYSFTDPNGCSSSQSSTTMVQGLPSVSLSGLDASYCIEAPVVQLTGSPAGGVYSGAGVIANAFDPALAGAGGPYNIIYSYTDTNNCKGADTLQVSVNDIPQLSIIGLDPAYCAWRGPVSLALVPAGGQLAGTGVSGNTFNPSVAGVGTHVLFYVYSDGGCASSIQASVVVDVCVGIDLPQTAEMKIYPNPTHGKINVEISGKTISNSLLSLYNMHGQQLLRWKMNDWKEIRQVIDLAAFSKGVYYLRLETGKEVVVKKVVLE